MGEDAESASWEAQRPTLEPFEAHELYCFALRYCMGRETIGAVECIDDMMRRVPELSVKTCSVMAGDLGDVYGLRTAGKVFDRARYTCEPHPRELDLYDALVERLDELGMEEGKTWRRKP